jgi:hypothetical protein
MKRLWIWSGCALLALAGCEQAAQDITKAMEEEANKVAEAANKAGEEAAATVEKTGEDAAAAVAGAGEDTAAAIGGAVGDLANLKVGDVDLGTDLTAFADNLKTTLAGVTDVDTAKAALPKLEEANLGLDKLIGLVDQLPATAKPALAALLKNQATAITEAVQRVVGIEGVGEVLKPILDQMAAKLAKAAGAEAAAAEPATEPAPAP